MKVTKLKKKTNKLLKYPETWNICFYNDDVTPIGFVEYILTEVFKHNKDEAHKLTMQIHNEGKFIVGSCIKPIAEAKILIASKIIESTVYPLKITLEPLT